MKQYEESTRSAEIEKGKDYSINNLPTTSNQWNFLP
jgi:hypothetical protein